MKWVLLPIPFYRLNDKGKMCYLNALTNENLAELDQLKEAKIFKDDDIIDNFKVKIIHS